MLWIISAIATASTMVTNADRYENNSARCTAASMPRARL